MEKSSSSTGRQTVLRHYMAVLNPRAASLSAALGLSLILAGAAQSAPTRHSSLGKDRESKSWKEVLSKPSPRVSTMQVRTTAYTHNEKDHYRYGRKNAIGTTLQYGKTRSAAADWSVFPLGTKFRIAGDPNTYVIDDYGSALVGTRTIDIYKPSRRMMNQWGVRHVDIRIVEMGSLERSLKMLSERTGYRHVREMVARLKSRGNTETRTHPTKAAPSKAAPTKAAPTKAAPTKTTQSGTDSKAPLLTFSKSSRKWRTPGRQR